MKITKKQYEIASDFLDWCRHDTLRKKSYIIGNKYTTKEDKQEELEGNKREMEAINILLQILNDSNIM